MKRGSNFTNRVLLAVLCSLLLVSAAGATSYSCPERGARVVALSNENWRPHLIARSATGGDVAIEDCNGFGAPAAVAAGGSVLVEDFDQLLCSQVDPIAVVTLPVEEGVCASYFVDTIFEDPTGDLNVVTIPELPATPLPEGNDWYTFDAVRNDGDYATFLAIIPDSADFGTRVKLTIYDGNATKIATETVTVNGFVFYEVRTAFTIGRVELQNIGSAIGPAPLVAVDVIGLTGFRDGGPRVVMPERGTPTIVVDP